MDTRTQCYICKKRIDIGEPLAEIIITKSAKNIIMEFVNLFKGFTNQLVCMDCLSKGIIWQPELKVITDTHN
ncbi:MAG: hypothetical protein ABIG69_11845 [Bacteroidota bacterium]